MRPIALGLILTMLGSYFWILLILVFGTTQVISGTGIPPNYIAPICIAGFIVFFSLPITAAIEAYQWLKRRRRQEENNGETQT